MGRPIAPLSSAWRAVWLPPPRMASGAQPTRRPAASAAFHKRFGVGAICRQRLLAVGVLAGVDDLPRDFGVSGGHGGVDNDVDVRARQQAFNGQRLQAVGGGKSLGLGLYDVRAGDDIDDGEGGAAFYVGWRNVPGSDEADVQASSIGTPR